MHSNIHLRTSDATFRPEAGLATSNDDRVRKVSRGETVVSSPPAVASSGAEQKKSASRQSSAGLVSIRTKTALSRESSGSYTQVVKLPLSREGSNNLAGSGGMQLEHPRLARAQSWNRYDTYAFFLCF